MSSGHSSTSPRRDIPDMQNIEPLLRPARILLLEDSLLDVELISEHLAQLLPTPEIHRAFNRADYVRALDEIEFDVILADFSLPDFDGMAALDMAHDRVPETPFIFVSGVLGEEAAIESFRRGATDYVLKQRMIRLASAVERALSESRERAERKRIEQHRELLVRELSHRVKNTMAMVMSIVRRTVKNSVSVDDYVENLMGRLRAMADAHALLFETNWKEAALQDVIYRTISAYIRNLDRVSLTAGPVVTLDPKAALAFSMVLNELAANALKYGSLSNDSGKVVLSWSVTEDQGKQLNFEWREVGGPPAQEPTRTGFGTTLISRTIEYELQGKVATEYSPSGLVCKISWPLQDPAPALPDGITSSYYSGSGKDVTH